MSETAHQMLGITVLPEYFQVEGITNVLDNCQSIAGANAITTSPYVMRLAGDGDGQREPPIDAGAGKVRLLDRPLWGRKELRVNTSPSFFANKALYQNTAYQPPEGDEYTKRDGAIITEALSLMKSRGLRTFFQIQAAIPPGYRVQFSGVLAKDQPLMPQMKEVTNRVAANASLASEDVINYQTSLMIDLFQQYPDVDGIRIDWPEYPPYKLDSIFLDFNPQVRRFCKSQREFERLRVLVSHAYEWLHGRLDTATTIRMRGIEGLKTELQKEGLYDGLMEWLKLKQEIVTTYIRRIRESIDGAGFQNKLLVPHAFPPPFHYLSGVNYGALASYADHIPIKMYTMHWSMIARFYLDQLSAKNPQVEEAVLVQTLFSLLSISDDAAPSLISEVCYPGPEDPQLQTKAVQAEKFRVAKQEAGDTPIAALVHGYGPVDEFAERFKLAYETSQKFVWVNRYCYLSDEKLRVMGTVSHEG